MRCGLQLFLYGSILYSLVDKGPVLSAKSEMIVKRKSMGHSQTSLCESATFLSKVFIRVSAKVARATSSRK